MRTSNRQLKLFVVMLSAGLAAAAVLVALRPAAAQANDPTEFFEKRIRPVLTANCAKCHNPKAQVAQLDVTPVVDMRWGMHEFTLADPSGNRLRIGRALGTTRENHRDCTYRSRRPLHTRRTARPPTWTDRHRRILREKRGRRWYANRSVVEREPELPSRPDDGSELFNRSP